MDTVRINNQEELEEYIKNLENALYICVKPMKILEGSKNIFYTVITMSSQDSFKR